MALTGRITVCTGTPQKRVVVPEARSLHHQKALTTTLTSCACLLISGSCLSQLHPPVANAAALRSPSQYMPAWDFAPTERDQAFTAVLSTIRELQNDGAAELLEADKARGYTKARIRYELRGKADWDVLEVWLRDDQIALFRMESDVTLPNPPGCFFKNCINGPRTRGHAAAFQARLGWPSLETDEEKGWKPLFFH